MIRTKALWPAVCLVLLSSLVHAADGAKASLAWKLRQKDRFFAQWHCCEWTRARQGANLHETVMDLRAVSRFTVLEVDKDRVVLEQKIVLVQHHIQGSQTMSQGNSPLQGAILQVTLSADMKVLKVEGLEAAVGIQPGGEPLPQQKAQLQGLDFLLQSWLHDIFLPLPAGAVRKGQTWGRDVVFAANKTAGMKQQFTYQGPQAGAGRPLQRVSVRVEPLGGLEASKGPLKNVTVNVNTCEGNALVDADAGRVVQLQLERTQEGKGTLPGFLGGKGVGFHRAVRLVQDVRLSADNPLEKQAGPALQLVSHREEESQGKGTTNSLGMKLVRIPAGRFTMGARGVGGQEATPPFEVEISRPFFMGAHEVTIGQYRRFVEATGYRTEAERTGLGCCGFDRAAKKMATSPAYSWRRPGWAVDDRHPVVNLSWADAREFCAWLSKKEGKPYRLPTEAEWEYACRAGTTTAYSSGDEPESLAGAGNVVDAAAKKVFPTWQAHRGDDGFAFTSPVGSFAANAWGLYDMHGNAMEWCEDWYFPYPAGPVRDPQGPAFGLTRVQRGGSFADFPQHCTSAYRTGFPETSYCVGSGFRVVVSEEPARPWRQEPSWVGKKVLPRSTALLEGWDRKSTQPLPDLVLRVSRERFGVLYGRSGSASGTVAKDDMVLAEEAVALYTEKLETEESVSAYCLRAAARRALGQAKEALADLDHAIALDEENPWLYAERARHHQSDGRYKKALGDLRRALGLKKDNLLLLNTLAWDLATCPDARVRDGEEALKVAERAVKLGPAGDGTLLATLAAANAAAGRFDEAVRCETKALANPLYATVNGEQSRKRLELYRKKEPYREPREKTWGL
jgi:formylglycine-generating enzyme required for sulfatase activity